MLHEGIFPPSSFTPRSVFRAISLQLGIQSHHLLQFGVRATISSQFGFQSHVFSLAFRVASSIWLLEPPFLFSLVFRATISSQFGRLEPPFLLSLGV